MLATAASQPDSHRLKYIPSIGVEAGFWWGELLSDQRPVDAFSLVYDSAPLQDELAIMGRPNALLPMVLSTPYSMTTSLQLGDAGGSRITLPVVPVKGVAARVSPPQPAEE